MIVLPVELRKTFEIAVKDQWRSMWTVSRLSLRNMNLHVFSAVMQEML